MINSSDPDAAGCDVERPDEQPIVLRQLLAGVNAARKTISMYGADHPNSLAAVEALADAIKEFTRYYERATCVFGQKAVVVNEHYYAVSRDSVDMCERLRARGAMAFTLTGVPPTEQVYAFVGFLNAEPKGVRAEGGPSSYLRRRGVGRIVLTETIYAGGDGTDEEERDSSAILDAEDEDSVIAAVIDWLSRQDEDEDPAPPRLPITQILSKPDSAARLIREAVTKLHASRRDATNGEVVNDAVNDLKALAGHDSEEWDKATPQIRKAISKLPIEMRPGISGFSMEDDQDSQAPECQTKTADISEAESMVHKVLDVVSTSQGQSTVPSPATFEQFFGARAFGLLSSWKRELQPVSVLVSSGRTLQTLMEWETNACEHGRIALALAYLASRAMEVEDSESAMLFAEALLDVANRDEELGWRRANIRAALESMDHDTRVLMLRLALEATNYRGTAVAGSLLRMIPALALNVVDLMGTPRAQPVERELRDAVAVSGQAALPALGRMLRGSSAQTRRTAIEILVNSGRSWAVEEIASAMKTGEELFIVEALELIPGARIPMVTELCVGLLSHRTQIVRCAAIKALGVLGDTSALPHLIRIAVRKNHFGDASDEQVTAIEALGRMSDPEAIDCLRRIARHRPLFGKSRHEAVRCAAERIVEQIDMQHPTTRPEAA